MWIIWVCLEMEVYPHILMAISLGHYNRPWHFGTAGPRKRNRVKFSIFRDLFFLWNLHLPSGKHPKNYRTSSIFHRGINYKMAIFNSYFDISRGYIVGSSSRSPTWHFQSPAVLARRVVQWHLVTVALLNCKKAEGFISFNCVGWIYLPGMFICSEINPTI